MRNLQILVVALIFLGMCPAASAAEFAEDFESYASGSDLHGQNGWKGWDNAAGAGSPTSSDYAFSGTNSVEIIGAADLVHVFDVAGGRWEFTAMQYIPSGTTGISFFILMNTYSHGGTKDWSVQTEFNLDTGVIDYWHGGSGQIIYDQWIELKYVINLDENTVDKYYNGEYMVTDTWDNNNHGTLQAIDLYGNSASSIYYDDIMIEAPPGAYDPEPADGGTHAATWVTLRWGPGVGAVSHDVYLSDNYDDVSDGAAEAFRGNQTAVSLVAGFPTFPYPDGLVPGTTYYWRIDEIGADGTVTDEGDVWSFMVPPRTAYSPDPANGTGFVEADATFTWEPGFDGKLHYFHIGDSFEDVNNAAVGLPLGAPTYNPGPLEPEKVLYWRIDEFDGAETHKGDVWGFTTTGAAGNPQPANGDNAAPLNATLAWTPADTAASHDLYYGTDAEAVRTATTSSPEYMGNKALGSESHNPGKLAWDTAYFWRVDAVYAADPGNPVKGLVWSFKAADFIGVDDFESYNDIDPPEAGSNRIFDAWVDGFETTTNGAVVGNDLPPYAGQFIVHGGLQSMPYSYNNNLKTSEATLTLVYPRDWTDEGVTELSLWFVGKSNNAAERMYVALNGNAVVYHGDPAATRNTDWTRWVIDLQEFADQGVNLASVNTITIGFGTKNSPAAGGTGQMHFDDIQLTKPPAAPAEPGVVNVPRTSVAPVIDGQWDAVWNEVGETQCLITDMVNTDSATPENSNDLSAIFKASYDDNNFYIMVEVQDSVIDYEFSTWNGDGVEIYFDGDNSKGDTYDGVDDNQIRITVDDVEPANIDSSLPVDGTEFKVLLTDLGYNVEAAFPLAKLQISPDTIIGFEVQINDNDSAGGRETLLRWCSDDNDSWQNPSLFGLARLLP
ncbi:MAG: sugar-binding protein [Planctomycetota bacterium]